MADTEWYEAKARANLVKHGVSFFEADAALADPRVMTYPDLRRPDLEERWISVGLSNRLRLITVVTGETPWGSIRIISAWRATKRERHGYETRAL
jgi:uncharacterized DUF497 family protein